MCMAAGGDPKHCMKCCNYQGWQGSTPIICQLNECSQLNDCDFSCCTGWSGSSGTCSGGDTIDAAGNATSSSSPPPSDPSLMPHNFTSRPQLMTARDMWCAANATVVAAASAATSVRYTTDGCECKKEWSNSGQNIMDYCGNPDNDPNGDWCAVVSQSCQGDSWGTCQAAGAAVAQAPGRVTTSGCECKKEWSNSGQNIMDYCGNPDNDPGGDWCAVVSQSCQGDSWGTCQPTAMSVYGAIENWDVSRVSDLSYLFCAEAMNGCNPNCQAFNEAVGTWDVSRVTNLEVRLRHPPTVDPQPTPRMAMTS